MWWMLIKTALFIVKLEKIVNKIVILYLFLPLIYRN